MDYIMENHTYSETLPKFFLSLLEDKEEVKESQTEDNKDEEAQEGKQTEDHESREEEEKLEEASELSRKPKMRHSFNLRFRRRPKSMAAAIRKQMIMVKREFCQDMIL